MTIKDKLKGRRQELGLTLKDIAEKVGVSEGTVSRWESGDIANMRRDKIVKLADALQISPSVIMGWDDTPVYSNIHPIGIMRLPILGRVACGEPIFMAEEKELYVDTTTALRADFALIAKGDSMTGARIFDGDIVFVRKQDVVENGEIAVVAVNDEATLKRFYKYGDDLIVLRAENPAYKDMEFHPEDGDTIRVLGKAIAFQSDVK